LRGAGHQRTGDRKNQDRCFHRYFPFVVERSRR
jgi:hypothetical protein